VLIKKYLNLETTDGIWVAKLIARLLAPAALWVRIQTSLKNTKWATSAMEWPTHSSPPKKICKKIRTDSCLQISTKIENKKNIREPSLTEI
jgi:hypothetical protein